VLSRLSEAARRPLEDELNKFGYEYQTDFARKYVAEGRLEEARRLVLRQIARKVGLLPQFQRRVEALDLDGLEALAEALLAFRAVADLQAWLDKQIEAETIEREPYVFDDPVMEARAEGAIAQADMELAARDKTKPNVNFCWENAPLDMVRLAAELAGVPYETWMKQVLYEQAVQAITAAREVDARARKPANI